jgi:hypothetical protein
MTNNKQQTGVKLYTEHYALIISDEQAKENDWGYVQFQGGDVKLVGKYFADDWKKNNCTQTTNRCTYS